MRSHETQGSGSLRLSPHVQAIVMKDTIWSSRRFMLVEEYAPGDLSWSYEDKKIPDRVEQSGSRGFVTLLMRDAVADRDTRNYELLNFNVIPCGSSPMRRRILSPYDRPLGSKLSRRCVAGSHHLTASFVHGIDDLEQPDEFELRRLELVDLLQKYLWLESSLGRLGDFPLGQIRYGMSSSRLAVDSRNSFLQPHRRIQQPEAEVRPGLRTHASVRPPTA
jgi:hypothetical protein